MRASAKQSDREHFRLEALPHMGALFRFSLGMAREAALAEDLVQETYQEAWKSFSRYAPGTDCKAWLFRILFRVWSRQRRAWNRMQPQLNIEQLPEDRLAVQPDLNQRLERQQVLRVLYSLPEHYRQVLILADIEEFSYRQIAGMLQLPMGTVMSRLKRGRDLFRKKFQQPSQASESA